MDRPQRDFFISYTSVDETWAEWIAHVLEGAGYTVVIQAWDFRPGSNFVLQMQEALSSSARLIAVLSPDYLSARYPQPEWAAVFAQDPEGAQRRLVPVMVRQCTPTGLLAQVVQIRIHHVDDATAKQKLLDGVKLERAKPIEPPAFPGTTTNAKPVGVDGETGNAAANKHIPTPPVPQVSTGTRTVGRLLRTVYTDGSSYSVAYSPDGRYVATGHALNVVGIWRADTGRKVRTVTCRSRTGNFVLPLVALMGGPDDSRMLSVSWSPDGRYVAAAGADWGKVWVFNTHTGNRRHDLHNPKARMNSVAWSPDGRHLATADADWTIWIWQAGTGTHLRTLAGHTGAVNSVAWSPDGRHLASAGDDITARIFNADSGAQLHELNGHTGGVWSAAWTPDGQHLATASADRTIRIWHRDGRHIHTYHGHAGEVLSVAWSPDGRHLASGGSDGTTRIWPAIVDPTDDPPGAELCSLSEPGSSAVRSVSWAPHGRHIASCGFEAGSGGKLRIWEVSPSHA